MGRTLTARRSSSDGSRWARPSASNASNILVTAGTETFSARASSDTLTGPPNTITDSSDCRAGVMTPLLEAAEHHGLIISTHSSEPAGHLYAGKGRTTPDVLWRFIQNAQEFPNVRIICAHWGGGLPFYALMPEVKETLRNVYFDTATSPFLYTADVFSTVERLVGADKILFGSDYPLLRPRRLLKQLEESGLLEETQQAIRTSGLRLLGL